MPVRPEISVDLFDLQLFLEFDYFLAFLYKITASLLN